MKRQRDRILARLGKGLFAAGVAFLLLKAALPEYVDGAGLLHEAFFLLPAGYFCIFSGLAVLAFIRIRKKLQGD